MEPLGPLQNPVSLKSQAYRSIKDAILSLQLKPGDALVEADLAQRLGISKTPVRDALLELEKEGLVMKVLFKGTYVTPLTQENLVDIFEVRAVLEGLAARLAAETFTAEDIQVTEKILQREQDAVNQGNSQEASRQNTLFHELIIHKSDNRLVGPMLANLDDQLNRYRLISSYQTGRLEKSIPEHYQVLDAFRNRDSGLAEKYMRAHIRSVEKDLILQNVYQIGEETFELTPAHSR